jgi:hypothetical protein
MVACIELSARHIDLLARSAWLDANRDVYTKDEIIRALQQLIDDMALR